MNNTFDRHLLGHADTSETPQPPIEPHDTKEADDRTSTSLEVKEVTQALLKFGYLEEVRNPTLFQKAVVRQHEIMVALEPLDLVLRLDTHRGVAFLKVAETAYDISDESDAWTHPLVRRQRLTLEQSLLIAILRQTFVIHEQESGIGQSSAKIAIDEILPQFLMYFEDSGSDARNESRLSSLLDQLKTYGIVSEIDKNHEVTIRPMIAHLANPDSLTALLQVLKEKAQRGNSTENGA